LRRTLESNQVSLLCGKLYENAHVAAFYWCRLPVGDLKINHTDFNITIDLGLTTSIILFRDFYRGCPPRYGHYLRRNEARLMTVSEISQKYGLAPDTLRYYECVGLIPRVARASGGILDYGGTDCRRIEKIIQGHHHANKK